MLNIKVKGSLYIHLHRKIGFLLLYFIQVVFGLNDMGLKSLKLTITITNALNSFFEFFLIIMNFGPFNAHFKYFSIIIIDI